MAGRQSSGTCALCDESFPKASARRHLTACPLRTEGTQRCLRLVVEGGPRYWLHVEASVGSPLGDLDAFLRETWLECCGHLSEFEIEGKRYTAGPPEAGERGMEVTLEAVLRPGLRFGHRYDFGSTTELSIKVLAELQGRGGNPSVRILVRNIPPLFPCMSCQKPATLICTECCLDQNHGPLCASCGKRHRCGEEMLRPLVNSPRAGVCGYSG